jgi:hypothetical protein
MRTTLTIDDDMLAAAKGLAARQKKTIGEMISALSRQALRPPAAGRKTRNGVPLPSVRPGAMLVTPEMVNQLRDDSP